VVDWVHGLVCILVYSGISVFWPVYTPGIVWVVSATMRRHVMSWQSLYLVSRSLRLHCHNNNNHVFFLPNTTMTTKPRTKPHLGSMTLTLTLPSSYSPDLLHNCRGLNWAQARFIMLMTCPVIFPTALPVLPTILRRTISPCTCVSVSVCKCELWSRDAPHDETTTPDQPARWFFLFERPSQLITPIFPAHTKIPYIVGSTCLSRPWEWKITRIGSPKGPVACWEPLALITYYPTPSKLKSNQNSPPKQYHPP